NFLIEDEELKPNESTMVALDANLTPVSTEITYSVLNINYDQNPGSSSALTWHYIVDDSTIGVPGRQNVDGPTGFDSWMSINPERGGAARQAHTLSAEGYTRVAILSGTSRNNS